MALYWFPEFAAEIDVFEGTGAVVEVEVLVAELGVEAVTVSPPRVQYVGLYLLAGDFRGRYGYGRASHRTDPDATYEFRPVSRTLPPRGRR